MLIVALSLGLALAAGGTNQGWTDYSVAQNNLFQLTPTRVERLSRPVTGYRLTVRLANRTDRNLCFSTGWAFGSDRPENIIPQLALYDLDTGKDVLFHGPVADIESVWPYFRVLAKGAGFEGHLIVDDSYYPLQKGHRYHLDYAEFAYDCDKITDGQDNVSPGIILELMLHFGRVSQEASHHGVVYHLSYDFTYGG